MGTEGCPCVRDRVDPVARDFSSLAPRAQVHRMRSLAHEALHRRGLHDARLRLLEHGFNTTFRVDTAAGDRFALRLGVGSVHGPGHVEGEVQWLAALAADTDLVVPAPVAHEGRLVVDVPSADLARVVPTVLFRWLPGRDLGDAPTPARWRAVGTLMARLHAHGAVWCPTDDAPLPLLTDPLQGTTSNLDDARIDDASRIVLHTVEARARLVFEQLRTMPAQAIHADLHAWNLKWYRGRVAVLDFDDCGIGLPVQDLAICCYHLRDDDESVDALLEGYRVVAPLPLASVEQFESLVAARNLVLLNDLLVTTNAELSALVPAYLANTILKLRRYLDEGVYRHSVPGVVPLGG